MGEGHPHEEAVRRVEAQAPPRVLAYLAFLVWVGTYGDQRASLTIH